MRMNKEHKRTLTGRRILSGALALIMTASFLTEPAAAVALQNSDPILLEASRLDSSTLPEGNLVYFGTASVTLEESNQYYTVPIYREGDLSQEAGVDLHTIDLTAIYGEDYEMVMANVEETGSDETVLETYMEAAKEAEKILAEEEAPVEDEAPAEDEPFIEEEAFADDEVTAPSGSSLAQRKEEATGEATRVTYQTEGQTLLESAMQAFIPEVMNEMDYSSTMTLTFAPGEDEKWITFRLKDDSKSEGTETFSLLLTNPVGVEVYEVTSLSVTISDDEPIVHSTVSFTKARYDSEGGVATVVVERTGAEYSLVDMRIHTSEDTAKADEDYDSMDSVLTFLPYETEKEVEFYVGGAGSFSVVLEDFTACQGGQYTRTKVYISEEDSAPRLRASAGSSFTIKVDGKSYTVEYTPGKPTGKIMDTTTYDIPLEVGTYYFALPASKDGYFSYSESQRSGSKPWGCGVLDCEYVEQGNQHDSYGDVAYYHTSTWKNGEVWTTTKDAPIPTAYYQFLAPDWQSSSNFGGGQKVRFDIDTLSKSTTATGKFDRTQSNGSIVLQNIGNTNYNGYVDLSAHAVDDDSSRTPKSYLRFYGVAAMYKEYSITISDPAQMDFRTGNLLNIYGGIHEFIKYTPVQAKVQCGAQDPIGSSESRLFYANSDTSNNNLIFSLSDAEIGGTNGIFGVITGYTITVNSGTNAVKLNYPSDFIAYLNQCVAKKVTGKVAKYSSSDVNAEIEKINDKLNTIPFDVYFVDWIDTNQKAVKAVKADGSGYSQSLHFQPIVEYIDTKVTVLAPSGGVDARFADPYLGVGTSYSVYHAGDILDLSVTCKEEDYHAVGYQVSTDGGVHYDTVTSTTKLQLLPNKSYTIRPVVAVNDNRIEIQFQGDAKDYITVLGASNQGLVEAGVVDSDLNLTGRTILNLNPEKSTVVGKMSPTVGEVYSIAFAGKQVGDTFYRPVITDAMTGTVYQTQILHFAGRGDKEDNVLKVSYEAVKDSEWADFTLNGTLVSNYAPIRADGLKVKQLGVSGYTVSASQGTEAQQSGKVVVETASATTDETGGYTLSGIRGKTGDRVTLLASNGADQQILETVLGGTVKNGAASMQMAPQALSYPSIAPYVSSIGYNYDKSTNNDSTDNTQSSVKLFDDTIRITAVFNRQNKEVSKVIFKHYNPALGLIGTYDTTKDATSMNPGAVLSGGTAVLTIPKMLDNLHNGDYITVSLAEQQIGSDGTVYDIVYPEVDLGLVFYIENSLLVPKTYDTQATTAVNIPIVGAASASASSGLLSFSRTNWANGKGYTVSINGDLLMYNTTTPGTEDKANKFAALHAAAEQTQTNLDAIGPTLASKEKSFDDSALALLGQVVNDEISQEDYENLRNSLDEQKAYYASLEGQLEDEAKEPMANFTKSKIMRFDILFLLAFDFLYNEETQEYVFCCGSVAIAGTANYSQSIYSVFYGVPVFVNFTGSVQADMVVSYQTKEGEAALTAGEFDNYAGNIADRLSNTKANFGLTLSLKAQAGAGMCGVMSARGYVTYQMQFSVPTEDVSDDYGVLLMASGGIGFDLLILSIDVNIGTFRSGFGIYENMTGISFINGTIPLTASLRSSRQTEEGETLEVQKYTAGTADFSGFGGTPLRQGIQSHPTEVSRTILLNDAADRTRPQLVELSDGSKMLFFIGSRGDADELNSMALYYSICEDGVWSIPEMVADDGTADSDPTVLEKNGKVVVAWADADRPFTEDDTNLDKLNALGISMAIYEDGKMGKEITLVEDEFFNFAPQLNLAEDTLYCSYMKRDISNVKTEEELVDYTNTYSTMAYVACDVSTRTAEDEQFIVIKHPVLTDPLVMDYHCVTTEVDGVNYMLSTYTVDEDGNLTTNGDRELFLAIKDLDSGKDFYPIALTNDQLNQAIPQLNELNGTVYLSWLESGTVFSLLNISDLLESLFAPGSIEASSAEDDSVTTIDLTSVAEEYLASAQRGDEDWFRKSAEDLGLEDEVYEKSIYESLAQGSVRPVQANFHDGISTSISDYLLATNGDDIYVFYTAGTQDENDTGVELFGARYQQDLDDEDDADEAWGFGQSVQVSHYGKVIDEIALIMNEENDISVVSNFYDQWIDGNGYIQYGPNQLVEIDFRPMGSLSIRNDDIDLPGNLSAGNVENISFQVENEGLLTATGFDVTVSQVTDGAETVIYEDSIQAELDAGEAYEVVVPWTIPADPSNTSIKVVVNEHDVAIANPTEVSVKVPYTSKLSFSGTEAVWDGTKGYVTTTIANTGNKASAGCDGTLSISSTDGSGKTYATFYVPALASGESFDLTIPFTPAVEDFEALGYIDLALKASNGESEATANPRFIPGTPIVTEINGGDENLTVRAGRTAKATAAVGPWESLAGEAIYTIEDPTIATVDSDGTVRGVAAGTTTLKVSYLGCTAEDTIQVTVSDESSSSSDSSSTSKPAIKEDTEKTETPVDTAKEFADVHPVNHWAKSYVDYVVSSGIFSGTSDTTFSPDAAMTRGMVAKVLHNLEGNPAPGYDGRFDDIADGSWYEEAVYWAAGEGIVSGYGNGLYGPNDPVTREQLATILYRYAQSKGQGFTGDWMFLLDYADRAEVSAWAYEPMCWMTMKGIINGTGNGMLDPKGCATRAQVAAMLQRFCENVLNAQD